MLHIIKKKAIKECWRGVQEKKNHPYLQQCDSGIAQERPQDGFQVLRQEATVKCRQMSNDPEPWHNAYRQGQSPKKNKILRLYLLPPGRNRCFKNRF